MTGRLKPGCLKIRLIQESNNFGAMHRTNFGLNGDGNANVAYAVFHCEKRYNGHSYNRAKT